MRSRLYSPAALILTPLLLGGCVQATRHSNAMVFGTNTSFGIKVGTDATQIPSVLVGYNRQEAVVLPLVANVGEAGGTDGNGQTLNRLKPCDLTIPVTASSGTFAIHPCSLVAVNGKAMDSYSVLASFGADFDASGGGSNAAKGGLAQYFATGVAAQLLAATGGASVVAVGNAATASAIKAPNAEEAIEALYGNTATFKMGRAAVGPFDAFMDRLLGLIAATPAASLQAKVAAFETAAASPIKIAPICTDAKKCKESARDAYALGYFNNQLGFEAALNGWTIP